MEKLQTQKHLFNLISTIILLVGLGSAVLIYQKADNEISGAVGYEVIDGHAYPIMPEDSKMYSHDLELYGGKASVMIDEFNRWFIGLWQGKSLAFIVAFISIFISLVGFYAANHLPTTLKSNISGDKYPDRYD